MSSSDRYISFFTGTEIEVILLKGLLESKNIPCIIINEINSSLSAGYQSMTDGIILKIPESMINEALPVFNTFQENYEK